MTDLPLEPAPRSRLSLPSLYERISQNPVVLKELRGRMRGGRAFVILSIYLLVLSAMVGMVYIGFVASETSPGGGIQARQALGKAVFAIVVGMELMMVSFIAPALTASAISGERETQTYDLLRTTLLSARSLVLGKLFSSFSFILILLFVAIPLQTLAYLFGGVAISELVISFLILIVTALAFSAMGLFFSSFIRRTLVSTVLAYTAAIMIVFGIPVVVLTALLLMQSLLYGINNNISTVLEAGLIIVGWIMICINPLATAVATEVILIENQNLFYATIPLPSGTTTLYLVSPWIAYTLFYLFTSLLLIFLSIHYVRRPEK